MKKETIDQIESLELEIIRLNSIAKIQKFAIYLLSAIGGAGLVAFWV